jgi:predicted O-linked N-acetylglucosamine transferase (SPINDLY family)
MGVPTLTLAQPGMLGRQGQAVLAAAGLSQWVMQTESDYISAGQALARKDSPLLESAIALRANPDVVQKSSLFDTQQFVADWTAALRQAWRIRCTEVNAALSHVIP